MASPLATADGTRSGSDSGASSTSHAPSAVLRQQVAGRLQGKTGLARATDTGQRHQTRVGKGPFHGGQLRLPADEAAQLNRQVVMRSLERAGTADPPTPW